MKILGIENRDENWRTAHYFSPFFRDEGARLRLAGRLGEPGGTQASEVCINLFWYGMRDHLHPQGNYNDLVKKYKKVFAECYMRHFGELRDKIENFRHEGSKFADLRDKNYALHTGDEHGMSELFSNIFHTEIDVVLQTPNHLYIGEAKHEETFDANGKYVLVHQLIRQYVTARILVCRLVSENKITPKKVVPFVVRNTPMGGEQAQVYFMIQQGWMSNKNVLTWEDIKKLSGRP